MENTEFSSDKKYLLLLHHIENGVMDAEWHSSIEAARESVDNAWLVESYEIFCIKDAALVESGKK